MFYPEKFKIETKLNFFSNILGTNSLIWRIEAKNLVCKNIGTQDTFSLHKFIPSIKLYKWHLLTIEYLTYNLDTRI